MTISKILQILASPFFFLDKYLLVQIREKSNNKDRQNLTTTTTKIPEVLLFYKWKNQFNFLNKKQHERERERERERENNVRQELVTTKAKAEAQLSWKKHLSIDMFAFLEIQIENKIDIV